MGLRAAWAPIVFLFLTVRTTLLVTALMPYAALRIGIGTSESGPRVHILPIFCRDCQSTILTAVFVLTAVFDQVGGIDEENRPIRPPCCLQYGGPSKDTSNFSRANFSHIPRKLVYVSRS